MDQTWLILHKLESSDYFTENFQVKENITKMRNTHACFLHLLFLGVKIKVLVGVWIRFQFGNSFRVSI